MFAKYIEAIHQTQVNLEDINKRSMVLVEVDKSIQKKEKVTKKKKEERKIGL